MTSRVEYHQGGWMNSSPPEPKVLVKCPDCGTEQHVDPCAKIITCKKCGNK